MPANQQNRFRIEWGALALVLGIAGLFVALSLAHEYQDTLALEGERLQRQTRVVDENLIRQLRGADIALERIRADLRHQGPDVQRPGVSQALRSLSEAIPGAACCFRIATGSSSQRATMN